MMTFLKQPKLWKSLAVLAFLLWSLLYLWRIPLAPFHPDESTYIYMSSDFETAWKDPAGLMYQDNADNDKRQNYRLLDAPLTRTAIGFSRWITQAEKLEADWDWSLDWQANSAQGALPSPALLATSRWSLAIFTPFSVLLLFLAGKKLGGWGCGLICAALLALNPLLLLHTRRAMAESLVIFSACFWLWGMQQDDSRLQGVIAFISLNAKQSLLALAPLSLLRSFFPLKRVGRAANHKRWLLVLINFAVFVSLTYLVNPVLWKQPFSVGLKMVQARQEFTARNQAEWRVIAPEQVLDTPGKRLAALVYQLFFAKPAVDEIANYRQALQAQTDTYFSLFESEMLAGIGWQVFFFAGSFFGFISMVIEAIKRQAMNHAVRWILLGFGFQVFLLLLTIPLPYQRYWLATLPFFCLFFAFGVTRITAQVKSTRLKNEFPG